MVSSEYFMKVADITAEQSYCKRKQVGAVLVKDNFIIATGRNGTLPKHDNCCEDSNGQTSEFTLHAEQNILTFCNREGIKTKGSTLYVTLSPCKMCSKLIASAGIIHVIYKDIYKDSEGLDFLSKAKVKVSKYSLNI